MPETLFLFDEKRSTYLVGWRDRYGRVTPLVDADGNPAVVVDRHAMMYRGGVDGLDRHLQERITHFAHVDRIFSQVLA